MTGPRINIAHSKSVVPDRDPISDSRSQPPSVLLVEMFQDVGYSLLVPAIASLKLADNPQVRKPKWPDCRPFFASEWCRGGVQCGHFRPCHEIIGCFSK